MCPGDAVNAPGPADRKGIDMTLLNWIKTVAYPVTGRIESAVRKLDDGYRSLFVRLTHE